MSLPENVALRHADVVSMMEPYCLTYLADALYDRPEGRIPTTLADALGKLDTTNPQFEQLEAPEPELPGGRPGFVGTRFPTDKM